jgi:hypothetical protein
LACMQAVYVALADAGRSPLEGVRIEIEYWN